MSRRPEADPRRPAEAHALDASDVLDALGSGPEGLSEEEAARRLERHGPNALRAARPASAWELFVGQLKSVVVLLLVVAAAVALLMGEVLEAVAIGAVLVINTVLGFVTELRARRAMEALLRLEAPHATVIREGRVRRADARDLVPGDLIEVEAGQSVPADARIVAGTELRVNEATLTGESLPVEKSEAPVAHDAPLPERASMIFLGTTIVAGTGRAVVVATGMATELGRIGGLVETIRDERTPLESRLDDLGRRLVWIAAAIAALVAGLGIARGEQLGIMVETGIALAIAAVPEGLPAVATIALAAGVRRMARRRALVRRLPVVETLGSATVVCTDKTGTLTAGEMTLTTLWIGGREVEVSGAGYVPEGEFRVAGRRMRPGDDALLVHALRAAAFSSRGDVVQSDGEWRPVGDPTDVANIVAAKKAGLERRELLAEEPQVGELPFSSERQYLASFHETGGRTVAYVKGAPRRVLELCDTLAGDEAEAALDEGGRAAVLAANDELASRGLRVLALAAGPVDAAEEAALRGLTLIGLIGLIDPPASGVAETIDRLRDAGVRTIMLTGDQRLTAEAIARTLGMLGPGEGSLDDRDLRRLSKAELAEQVVSTGVFSRVSPESKLAIVDALQGRGEIVAMLGDGVNDAAALKKADIGVAMGMRGSDAAKEAAGVVLQDDRFQTVAAAVEEGRIIFDNIRKFVFYLFSCNLAEVLVLLVAGVAGLPVPLLPLQILWLNLVTDTFPALALAFEPAEHDVMRRPPRDPAAAILSGEFLRSILAYATLITAVTLAALIWGIADGASRTHVVTLSFATLAFAQIFHLANARSSEPVLGIDRIVSNRYAVGAVVLTVALQFVAIYWPPLASILRLDPLRTEDWLIVTPLSILPAVLGQGWKALRRRTAAGT